MLCEILLNFHEVGSGSVRGRLVFPIEFDQVPLCSAGILRVPPAPTSGAYDLSLLVWLAGVGVSLVLKTSTGSE